ncbi:mannan endo-1,4-beta-mannosidase [Saonia flava]|uniref:Mannan endo-1,4-beta-mannosidase n=1 Tax=Saonia flava TaxID=523696 RepID=A0A846QWU0_9FLAO|nr:glycosyl hydrolase [Saonia flava]NJB72811.1 mannan endo-1,4-beta-mannosidase [Saonia flava]
MKKKYVLVLCSVIALSSCKSLYNKEYFKPDLTDDKVSLSVKKLHKKLYYTSTNGFAIGHQDATSYGIGWNYSDNPNKIRSDVNDLVGDFPAVYGYDIGHIELAHKANLDDVDFDTMRKLIIEAHKNGSIITLSWHLDNPVTGGDSWDPTSAVSSIISGGSEKEKYNLWISRLAQFIKSLSYKGKKIPVIFRPFHEMNGAWFWWGESNCSAEDYKTLWKETVHLLRDKHKLHNIMYAYSPNKLNPNDDYLKYYPGDDYVDILGIDIYDFNNAEDYIKSLNHDLNLVREIAKEKNKLYAFTETGIEKIQTPNWFTEVIYPNIANSGIAWVLFWRNARLDHHYMSYRGHISEEDFKKFKELPQTLFQKDMNNLKY